jgi:hypothetical protein
MSYPNSY